MTSKKYFVLLLAACSFMCVSCKITSPGADYSRQLPLANQDSLTVNSFPLAEGNTWDYRITTEIHGQWNEGTVRRTVVGTSIVSAQICYKVTDEFNISGNKTIDTNYWKADSNLVMWYGSDHADNSNWLPTGLPSPASFDEAALKETLFNLGDVFRPDFRAAGAGPAAMTPYYPPRTLLDFPLTSGKQWVDVLSSNPQYDVMRKVLGQETITVPAGTFSCAKVQYIIFDVTGMVIYMWYSPAGLVKSQTHTTIEALPTNFTAIETYELTSYALLNQD